MPHPIRAHGHAAFGELRRQRLQSEVGLFAHPRQHPVALRGESKPTLPPIGSAAGLPVSRFRLAQRTTVAAPTENFAAAARQLSPADTAATTRTRKSRE